MKKTFLKGVLEKWHFPCFVIKTRVLINLLNYPARWNGRVREKMRENNKDTCWCFCSSLNSEWPFRSVLGARTGQFEMKDNANMGKRLKKVFVALKRLWTVAATEGIICSYNTFSPIIVTEVWLENVKSGLVQLKSSPLRSLLILISGIGCLNRLTNYILSSLIQSLPLFFSCSVRLPDARLSPCLSLFQLKWGLCSEYLNKLKGLFKQKEKKKTSLTLLATSLGGPQSFALSDLIQVRNRSLKVSTQGRKHSAIIIVGSRVQ